MGQQMFILDKQTLIIITLGVLIGLTPIYSSLAEKSAQTQQINTLTIKQTELQNELTARKNRLNTLPQVHVVWEQAKQLASIYPTIQVEPTTGTNKEIPDQSWWWGIATGSLPELIAFSRKLEELNNTQIYSLLHNENLTTLTFFVFGKSNYNGELT